MAKLNIAPTKSNLLHIKEQLAVAEDGYELLEQKREILVMELMRLVEKVKLLEQKINKKVKEAYPELKKMLMTVGGDRVERISKAIHYDFLITEKTQIIGGMTFNSIDVELPKKLLEKMIPLKIEEKKNLVNDYRLGKYNSIIEQELLDIIL